MILDMRKLSAKLVFTCLAAGKKNNPVLASPAILDQFRQDPAGFLNHLLNMDENCIYI
jgi:hypothetical protein